MQSISTISAVVAKVILKFGAIAAIQSSLATQPMIGVDHCVDLCQNSRRRTADWLCGLPVNATPTRVVSLKI